MIVAKTIKCQILNPTKKKLNMLNMEWSRYQDFIELEKASCDWLADKVPIYASYRQQARWYWNKFKKQNFPISISNQKLIIKKTNHRFAKYWIRIPVKAKIGGIWLPVIPHKEFPNGFKLSESKLMKKGNNFEIHIVVRKEVKIKKSYSSIIAVDIGEKVLATVLLNGKPIFYGREIRGIRRHYAWLRKRLRKRKLLKVIKRISNKEQRIVNLKLHEVSKTIVELAANTNSLIVLGNLKGIRESVRGKRFNRIVSNMAYSKLTQFITYKANWRGIKVMKIDERGTSITCSKCGYEDKSNRKNQGSFKCRKCGYQVNADFNGVKNIRNRSLEYISKDGVTLRPKNTNV